MINFEAGCHSAHPPRVWPDPYKWVRRGFYGFRFRDLQLVSLILTPGFHLLNFIVQFTFLASICLIPSEPNFWGLATTAVGEFTFWVSIISKALQFSNQLTSFAMTSTNHFEKPHIASTAIIVLGRRSWAYGLATKWLSHKMKLVGARVTKSDFRVTFA